MPPTHQKIDHLMDLLLDQTIAEFEKAKAEGKAIDPRRLVAAQKLIEAADPRALTAKEPPSSPVVDETTGEVLPALHPSTLSLAKRGAIWRLPFPTGAALDRELAKLKAAGFVPPQGWVPKHLPEYDTK